MINSHKNKLKFLLVLVNAFLIGSFLWVIHSFLNLSAKVDAMTTELSNISETQLELDYNLHIQNDLYDRLLQDCHVNDLQGQNLGVANAFRSGEISSVLIIGDSISDGNGDGSTYENMEERRDLGCRFIADIDGISYYEKPTTEQGWVKHFREYVYDSNYTVDIFDNNSIGEKSAKWANAHKEEWIGSDYDAIFVMLGTNDRHDCTDEREFYIEYSEFLEYVSGKCDYMVVITPPPCIEGENTSDNINIRTIVDTVLMICSNNGYQCIDLYDGLIEYAHFDNRPIDELYFGGTHPNRVGYLAIWRCIASGCGFTIPIGDMYYQDVTTSYVGIGINRQDIDENTGLNAVNGGTDVFPVGTSVYYTSEPFIHDIAYGGVLVTIRYENGNGEQVYKPIYGSSDYIRFADPNTGKWLEWSTCDRTHFAPEK